MRRNLLDALWVMAVLTCVVLVAVTGGSLLLALAADTSSSVGLDAWRGVVMTAPALVVAATLLAVLTVLRLRRDGEEDGLYEVEQPAVVHVVAEPDRPVLP